MLDTPDAEPPMPESFQGYPPPRWGHIGPVVSVVIPTWDRREVASDAVESALDQSFEAVEVVVVDDGSTDGTADALEREFGDRIRLVRRPHEGISAARNAGIAHARGTIVAFLDSYRRWTSDHVETVVATFERWPEAVLVSTNHEHREGSDRAEHSRLVDELPRLIDWNPVGRISACAARRNDLVAVGGFDTRLRAVEDYDLFLRLALRGRFAMLNRPLRPDVGHQPNSLTLTGKREGFFLACLRQIVAGAVELIDASSRADRDELVRRGRAWVAFFDAVRALDTGDDEGARVALAAACRINPELSDDYPAVRQQLKIAASYFHDPDPWSRSQSFAHLATLWPNEQSQTARMLRFKSLDDAYVARGLTGAIRALRGVPARQMTLAGRHVSWLARGGAEKRRLEIAAREPDRGPEAEQPEVAQRP